MPAPPPVCPGKPAARTGPRRIAHAALALACVLPSAAGAQELMGQRLFQQRCASCHALQPGAVRAGPHLAGVIGRTAGTVEGARYSTALRATGAIWDEATLDRFLADPRAFAPGTTMNVGVPGASERQAIIGFLKAAPAAPSP